jgi:hypothetical protein
MRIIYFSILKEHTMKHVRLCFVLALLVACVLTACGTATSSDSDDMAADPTAALLEDAPTDDDSALEATAMATEPTAAPEPTAAAPSLQAGPAKDVYAAGDTAHIEHFLVRVNDIKLAQKSELGTPKAGNQYLLVDVTLENQSSTSQDIAALLQMTMENGDAQYPISVDASLDFMALNGSIAPGEVASGVVGYEVPADAQNMRWVFRTIASDTSGMPKETGRAAFAVR